MKTTPGLLATVALLAACGRAPGGLGPQSAPQASRPEAPVGMTASAAASAAPTAGPTALAPPLAIPDGAPRVRIDATRSLHAASPYVNGYNRNHTHSQFGVHDMDRVAMLAQLRRLAPVWGQAYLAEQQQAGYPAKSAVPALYRTGHGPTDGRSDFKYLAGYQFQAYWDLAGAPGVWDGYAYDDMRYAIGEAAEAAAEPLVTVNFGSDTPESAGALARWLNAPAEPLRALRPFAIANYALDAAAPRGAFMFEIGNEVALPVVVGHDKANSVDEYVQNAKPYVEAVRAGSAHPVKVALAAAVNTYWGGPWRQDKGDFWPQRGALARAFVDAAVREGTTFDALQYHGYPTYPVSEKLAGTAYAENLLATTILPELAKAPWGPVEIWNDEFHAASALPRNTGIYGALYAASSVVTAFTLDLNGRQAIPVTTDFAVWHAGRGNGYDSLYFQDNRADRVTPIFAFRRLLAQGFGDWVLATEVTGVGAWQDIAGNGETTDVGNLHAVAARATDGSLRLLVVNRSRVDEAAWLDLAGFTADPAGATRALIAPEPGLADPWQAGWDQVQVREGESVDPLQPVAFPRASISILTLKPR